MGFGERHVPHTRGLGDRFGIDPNAIDIPGFYPRTDAIRNGLSDYLAEIEWAGRMLGQMIQTLTERNLLNGDADYFYK